MKHIAAERREIYETICYRCIAQAIAEKLIWML